MPVVFFRQIRSSDSISWGSLAGRCCKGEVISLIFAWAGCLGLLLHGLSSTTVTSFPWWVASSLTLDRMGIAGVWTTGQGYSCFFSGFFRGKICGNTARASTKTFSSSVGYRPPMGGVLLADAFPPVGGWVPFGILPLVSGWSASISLSSTSIGPPLRVPSFFVVFGLRLPCDRGCFQANFEQNASMTVLHHLNVAVVDFMGDPCGTDGGSWCWHAMDHVYCPPLVEAEVTS